MQNKDSNRLSALRALLSQTLNASKTSSPINTDMQMLSLLRKSTAQSKAASEEFKRNGREDLAKKEEDQVRVLEEYAGDVAVVGEEEIRGRVEGVIVSLRGEGSGEAKLQTGDVLKAVFKPDVLGEKNVERGEVARVVKEVLAEQAKKA
jgi:uncharacterized protein